MLLSPVLITSFILQIVYILEAWMLIYPVFLH
jgi:hypothetical protein